MLTLDKQQVQQIASDVERARITLNHLSHELVDHICCEVENHMSLGSSFDESYALVKQSVGIEVLKKVEENARYLIDKNYRMMKTTMKITGNIALVLLALGTLFKIQHWPGASISLLLGFMLLCFAFFPSALYMNYKYNETKRPLLHISAFLGGVLLMLGFLFKVQHWPGASALLILGWSYILLAYLPMLLFIKLKGAQTPAERWIYVLGITSLIIFEAATLFKIQHWPGASLLLLLGSVMITGVFLPAYTYAKFKESGIISPQFIYLVILCMYGVALTCLLSMNVSQSVMGNYLKDTDNDTSIAQYYRESAKSISPLPAKLSDSTSAKLEYQQAALIDAANKLNALLANIRIVLLQQADHLSREEALKAIENPSLIRNMDNMQDVKALMLGENRNGMAYALKEELDNYRKIVCLLTSADPKLSSSIALLLNTDNGQGSWEETNFRYNMLISTLDRLAAIGKNVGMTEVSALRHIQAKY